jgi:capsular polysaccharide biosynthesis protein
VEIKTYLNILMREWWVVLLCTVTALVAAYVLTQRQPVIYQSTATFIMRPRAELVQDQNDSVRVLETLGRHLSIASTYVEVASSRLIKQRAAESLNLSALQRENLSVNGEAVAGTNIIKISAQSVDPEIARDYANQVGIETVEFVSGLYEVFELEPLDAAAIPRNPVSPNLPLNLALGLFLGAALGVGLSLLIAYLRMPHTATRRFDIIDPVVGANNLAYFRLRLRAEVSRAKRTGRPFSLALIRITQNGDPAERVALQRAALVFQSRLREEDVLAYAGDAIFALILPETTGAIAKETVEELCIRLQADEPSSRLDENGAWGLHCSAGVSCFLDALLDADEFWGQAALALNDADIFAFGKVTLYSQLDGSIEPSTGRLTDWRPEREPSSV